MKKSFLKYSSRLFAAAMLAVFVIGSGLIGKTQLPPSLSPNQKLSIAAQIIENYYVEKVNGDTIVEEAIRAMLKTLDPHSSYSTPEETKELTQPLEGKFSGIGVQFNMGTDTVYVLQTTPGGPSEKVGIIPGDRIISANDTVIAGKKLPNSAILKALRGPKGSKVKLMVKRGRNPQLLEFIVTRDDIPMFSVDDVYMIDDNTGYMSVTRFAEDTPEEVNDALGKLKARGMKRLIIDLQSNTGGYLGAAVGMASLFLPKGSLVVYTEGLNSEPYKFNVGADGQWKDLPLVVLQDQYSASSSEIFAGAIQDNDRGLVVGRRSFGKGLVQRPFPFPDGSMIKLTVSRYHTPSGRCIQKHYSKGKGEEYFLDMLTRYNSGELWTPDSIRLAETEPYRTLVNGRTVYGGGGILPDLFVAADTSYYSPYYRDLIAKGSLNRFVLSTIDNTRRDMLRQFPDEEAFYAGFDISSQLDSALVDFGRTDSVKFDTAQWSRSKPMIHAVVKGLMARDLYKDGNYMRSVNPLNPVFRAAVALINDTPLYQSLIQGKGLDRIPLDQRKNYLLLPDSFRHPAEEAESSESQAPQ